MACPESTGSPGDLGSGKVERNAARILEPKQERPSIAKGKKCAVSLCRYDIRGHRLL